MRSSPAGLPPEILLGLTATAEGDMAGRESHHDLEGEEHDHDDFASFVVETPAFASLEELRRSRRRRAGRGRACCASRAAPPSPASRRAAVVQAVGPRIETYFAPGAAPSGLVVIGLRDLDRDDIAGRLTR